MRTSMTVAELIRALRQEDQNAQVVMTAEYGDRGRTMQALPITTLTAGVQLQETGYSNSGLRVVDMMDDAFDGDRIERNAAGKPVVVVALSFGSL